MGFYSNQKMISPLKEAVIILILIDPRRKRLG
jgi:hypothetical protein